MKGLGRATSAITVVNALLCGKGCAAAIALGCEVSVELDRLGAGELARSHLPEAIATPLVRGSLAAALRMFAPGEFLETRMSIASSIPSAKGLKSSSAVAVAIFDGVARALGRRADSLEIARAAADVAQHIGLSATGAFDDAVAAAQGGIAITDNPRRELLESDEMPADDPVLLWVPAGHHPPSSELASRFSGDTAVGEAAVVEALHGRYYEAMARSSAAVERAMAYDYAPLREKLLRLGALAAGVTGMGPALALVAPAERLEAIAARFPPEAGPLLRTRFRAPGEVGDPVDRGGGNP